MSMLRDLSTGVMNALVNELAALVKCMTDEGKLKIADFGCARKLHHETSLVEWNIHIPDLLNHNQGVLPGWLRNKSTELI
eukprot:757403-Hanusia_phi.AAC.4